MPGLLEAFLEGGGSFFFVRKTEDGGPRYYRVEVRGAGEDSLANVVIVLQGLAPSEMLYRAW